MERPNAVHVLTAAAPVSSPVNQQNLQIMMMIGFIARFGLFLLLVSEFAPSNALAQKAQEDSAAVASVVLQFHKALTTGDTLAAMDLLAEDVLIMESGDVETRDEYRAHHLAADIEYAKAVPSIFGPMTITVKDGVAWVNTTSVSKGTFHGRAVNSNGAELMVLTHDRGGWRIRSIHWSSRRRTEP